MLNILEGPSIIQLCDLISVQLNAMTVQIADESSKTYHKQSTQISTSENWENDEI